MDPTVPSESVNQQVNTDQSFYSNIANNPANNKMRWYEYSICAIPLVLMIVGGLLGGAVGGTAFLRNIMVWRSDKSTKAKIMSVTGWTISALIVYFVLLYIFGLVFSIIFDHKNGTPTKFATTKSDRLSSDSSTWVLFTPDSGGFSILFPRSPQRETQYIDNPLGGNKIPLHIYSVQENGHYYTLAQTVYDKNVDISVPKNNLEGALKGIVDSNGGNKLVSSSDSSFNNFPAKNFIYEQGPFRLKGRLILADHVLYQLIMGYTNTEDTPSTYDKFINSFQLVK